MRFIAVCASVVWFVACEESDLGAICEPVGEEMMQTPDVGEGGSEEVVFPATERKDGRCEYFSCVSTQVRSNYCSKECVADTGCPEGFVCSQLQPVGPLANKRFCLLAKTCRKGVVGDCPRETMECKEVATSDEAAPAFFCDQLKPKNTAFQ